MVEQLENIAGHYKLQPKEKMRKNIINKYKVDAKKLSYTQMPRSVEYDCDCGDGGNCDY
ncbi:MAG: hypothetical protein ACOCQQ_03120 [Candidatus Nanoarchaeia archaeon]